LTTFSSFSEGTAWAIAVGLSVIGIFTKVFDKIIVSIFGTVAVAGAIGIGLIILWAVGLAVAMNFLVGWSGIKAMKAAGIDAAKIEEATSTMRKGFGVLKGAAVAGTGST
jgi:hypothetical protein